MTQKVTTTESYKYDEEGRVLERTVTTVTEETTTWYTGPYVYPTSPYPYITYTTNTTGGTGSVTYGNFLTNDDDGDEPQTGVGG